MGAAFLPLNPQCLVLLPGQRLWVATALGRRAAPSLLAPQPRLLLYRVFAGNSLLALFESAMNFVPGRHQRTYTMC